MKPDPTEPSDLVNRLRQQLILSQVRIMELEDARDSQTPRLTELEQLLLAAQTLADRKLDEAAHLEKILAGIQAHLVHLQQQVNQDFESTSAAFVLSETQLATCNATVRQLVGDIRKLNAELTATKSSRSWRWTAWLRALDGKSGRKQA